MIRTFSLAGLPSPEKAISMLLLLISMTACSPRYQVISGEETIQVKKSTIDNLYADNERLLQALEQCRGK